MAPFFGTLCRPITITLEREGERRGCCKGCVGGAAGGRGSRDWREPASAWKDCFETSYAISFGSGSIFRFIALPQQLVPKYAQTGPEICPNCTVSSCRKETRHARGEHFETPHAINLGSGTVTNQSPEMLQNITNNIFTILRML